MLEDARAKQRRTAQLLVNRHRHAHALWKVSAGQFAKRPLLNVERANDRRAVAGLFLVAPGVLGVLFDFECQF